MAVDFVFDTAKEMKGFCIGHAQKNLVAQGAPPTPARAGLPSLCCVIRSMALRGF